MAVFHLQYRPKTVADLDLPKVREALAKILEDLDKIPQSLLFCGPKGSGKTSAARVVARVINQIDPNSEKNYLDIVELDAASNRGIDDVRNLREKVYLMPVELSWKVFIIDEVHMLTKEAFNALLKLLEEPPSQTMFILCTTDPGDIPETVLSRLVRVDFKKADNKEILDRLLKIEKAEKLDLENGVLSVVTNQADGSFRNGVRLLNELVLQVGKKISLKQAENFFADKSGHYLPEQLEEDLVSKSCQEILEKIEEEAKAGIDMESWLSGLVDFFQKKLIEGGGKLGMVRLSLWLNLLILACKQQKDCPLAQLPIQLAVAEMLKDEKKIKSLGAAVAPDVPVLKSEKIECTLDKVMEMWMKIISEVALENISVSAFLRASKAVELSGGKLLVEVFYQFHKDRLSETRNSQIIERCLKRVLGVGLNLELRLGESQKRVMVVKEPTIPEKPGDELYAVAKEIFG